MPQFVASHLGLHCLFMGTLEIVNVHVVNTVVTNLKIKKCEKVYIHLTGAAMVQRIIKQLALYPGVLGLTPSFSSLSDKTLSYDDPVSI